MYDLNDLRIFQKVGLLRSFSAAARAFSQPRSNVSRSVSRLEESLGTRLVHRTTRQVELTPAGETLMERCNAALNALGDALSYVGDLATEPHGELRVSVGIGFGINVLADQLPEFLLRYPQVDIFLELTSRTADLITEHVDVAIRFGPLPDSSTVAVRLGEMRRVLCAAPAYLERRGLPGAVEDLADHRSDRVAGGKWPTTHMGSAQGRAHDRTLRGAQSLRQ